MDRPQPLQTRMKRVDLGQRRVQERNAAQIVEAEQAGAQAVVDVMGVIGDVVGQRRALRLGGGEKLQIEGKDLVEGGDFPRNVAPAPEWDSAAAQRAVVLHQPFQRLPASG